MAEEQPRYDVDAHYRECQRARRLHSNESQGADDWAWDDGLQWRGSEKATALRNRPVLSLVPVGPGLSDHVRSARTPLKAGGRAARSRRRARPSDQSAVMSFRGGSMEVSAPYSRTSRFVLYRAAVPHRSQRMCRMRSLVAISRNVCLSRR
jgi:hypothetical protein